VLPEVRPDDVLGRDANAVGDDVVPVGDCPVGIQGVIGVGNPLGQPPILPFLLPVAEFGAGPFTEEFNERLLRVRKSLVSRCVVGKTDCPLYLAINENGRPDITLQIESLESGIIFPPLFAGMRDGQEICRGSVDCMPTVRLREVDRCIGLEILVRTGSDADFQCIVIDAAKNPVSTSK